MADNNKCGCKGIRTCLICKAKQESIPLDQNKIIQIFVYCAECCKAYITIEHPEHCSSSSSIDFDGIIIAQNFISEYEEMTLRDYIYKAPFVPSQSGRCKQDFGPKVNFKKKKLKVTKFSGLPTYARFLYDRMLSMPALANFQPVELCNLEYSAERGAAIDPHFDDFWLWGERLVTVNLLSSSVLSFTKDSLLDVEVHVPLERRSLIVVHGEARNNWKHAIHRQHIAGTRIAMTWRELTAEFLPGGSRAEEGRDLLEKALAFKGVSVAES